MMNFSLFRVGGLLCLGTIAGCTSFDPGVPRHHIGQNIELGKEQVSIVGDVMFSEFDYRALFAAVLTEDLEVSYQGMRISAPSGYTLLPYRISGTPGYCSPTLIMYSILGNPAKAACMFDRNSDWKFESVVPEMVDNFGEKEIPLVSYTMTEISESEDGFKYEFLYNGISGQTLNITYRDFSNNMTRPAFQQDLTYTLASSGPTDIAFRGARMTVYSANNSTVRYVVHSGVRR